MASIVRRALHILYSFILATASIAILYIPFYSLMFVEILSALSRETVWDQVIVFAILVVLSVYPATWSMRLLMRVFPFRSDGRKRWVLVFVIAIVVSGGMYLFWSVSYDFLALNFGWRTVRPGEDGSGTLFFGAIVILMTIPLTLTVALPLAWTALQHARRPEKRGLIYLRSFGAIGDTPIKRALLNIVPKNTQVAFIASPSSMPTSWDLSVVALGGFKWYRPWSNIPIYLSSRNDTWVEDITSWIEADTIIAIDVTTSTDGLLKELEIIERLDAVKRSVFLLNSGKPPPSTPLPKGNRIVTYDLSWLFATPRIGLMLVLGVAALRPAFYMEIYIIAFALLCMIPTVIQPSVSGYSVKIIRNAVMCALTERKKIIN